MTQKPSTRAGFRPPLPAGPHWYRAAEACARLDGQLDSTRLAPRLRRVTYNVTRLGNLAASFHIEGIEIDRNAAAAALAGRKAATPYERDIAAFGRLYDELHEASELPRLTPDLVLAWHARLFTEESLDSGTPGAWKTGTNGVWDTRKNDWVFLATPPEDTVAELDALFRWWHEEAYRLPAAMSAAILFAEFEAIHPFPDGNGRLGRMLHLFALKQQGLANAFLVPIDERMKARQDDYYAALASTNSGRSYEDYLAFHLGELRAAYENAANLGRLDALFAKLPRASARPVLEWILSTRADDWFARGDYPNEEGLSDATLSTVLAELVGMGVLVARGERKGRKYRVEWGAVG